MFYVKCSSNIRTTNCTQLKLHLWFSISSNLDAVKKWQHMNFIIYLVLTSLFLILISHRFFSVSETKLNQVVIVTVKSWFRPKQTSYRSENTKLQKCMCNLMNSCLIQFYVHHHSKGGGSFDDSDLLEVSGGNYKPDGGRSGGGRTSVTHCVLYTILLPHYVHSGDIRFFFHSSQ